MTDEASDLFARFSYDKDKISAKRVHHKLFGPKDGALSVQKINCLSQEEIKAQGVSALANRTGSFYGWAKLTRSDIETAQLNIEVDNDPPRWTRQHRWLA